MKTQQKRRLLSPIANPYTYQEDVFSFEKVSPISQTIPNQVPDLATLLGKRAVGIAVPQFNAGYSDQDFPDVHQMDKLDILSLRTEIAEQMEEMSQRHHDLSKQLETISNENRFKAQMEQTQKAEQAKTVEANKQNASQ